MGNKCNFYMNLANSHYSNLNAHWKSVACLNPHFSNCIDAIPNLKTAYYRKVHKGTDIIEKDVWKQIPIGICKKTIFWKGGAYKNST